MSCCCYLLWWGSGRCVKPSCGGWGEHSGLHHSAPSPLFFKRIYNNSWRFVCVTPPPIETAAGGALTVKLSRRHHRRRACASSGAIIRWVGWAACGEQAEPPPPLLTSPGPVYKPLSSPGRSAVQQAVFFLGLKSSSSALLCGGGREVVRPLLQVTILFLKGRGCIMGVASYRAGGNLRG